MERNVFIRMEGNVAWRCINLIKKKCVTKLRKGGNLDKDKFLIGLEG
jgi:hypothetical protein